MREDLAGSAARGVAWVGGGQLAQQLIRVPTSIVLARLLLPEDFGLLSMAMVFVVVGQLFADFGIGAAIVQSPRVDRTALVSSFWANCAIGLAAAALLWSAAPLVAGFYAEPRVAAVLRALGAGLVLSAMTAVPRAILHKRMDFRADARARLIGALSGATVAASAAWSGLGVWALVLQVVVDNAVTLGLSSVWASWWPGLGFSWRSIRPLLSFSAGVLGSSMLGYSTRSVDNVLIGRALGGVALGHYALAYRMMLYPLAQVSGVLVKVLFPTLSTLQGDPSRFRRAYLVSVGTIAAITFPMMLGLLAVAHDFIVVVFGEKWLPMEHVLRVFCVLGMVQSVGTTVGTLYLSTGKTRKLLLVNLVSTPVILASFIIGLRWGILGVAVAYATASLALFYVSLGIAFRIIGLGMAEFHRTIGGPAVSSLLMFAAVSALPLIPGWPTMPRIRLPLAVAVGVAVYGAASWAFSRRQWAYLVLRIRLLRAGPAEA